MRRATRRSVRSLIPCAWPILSASAASIGQMADSARSSPDHVLGVDVFLAIHGPDGPQQLLGVHLYRVALPLRAAVCQTKCETRRRPADVGLQRRYDAATVVVGVRSKAEHQSCAGDEGDASTRPM